MKVSLRAKLIGISLLAGVLPLLTAALIVWTLGYRQRVAEQGERFQNEASHVSSAVGMLLSEQGGNLHNLIALGGVAEWLAKPESTQLGDTRYLEDHWASLTSESPEMRAVVQSELATRLRTFQRTNPIFAEILVADRYGRLVAATNKTTDYDQSDESWWRRAGELRPGEAFLEGLDYDRSSGIFSLDIAVPVLPDGSGKATGVVKAVLNINPLLATLPAFSRASDASGEIVRPDGRIVLGFTDSGFRPGDKHTVSAQAIKAFEPDRAGWFILPFNDSERTMVGYAPVSLLGVLYPNGKIHSDAPFYIAVYQPAKAVLAPLQRYTAALLICGAVGILLCIAGGIFLIQRNVLRPIEILRRAAAAMAAAASRLPAGDTSTARRPAELADVARIHTGDEMEELARDFSTMAERLVDHQGDLAREIAEKTADIQRDLDMARDFQQAFLPRSYPRLQSIGDHDELTLNFHHIYQAAATVSGDFFDIIKLNDHCVGVLIADVMGHGTRSALVTAILRTILHGLGPSANNPAHFLTLLNRHYFDTMRQADHLIFVSICYVVIDTRMKVISCASAGHPSPLVGNRNTGSVEPLFRILRDNPAIGLFPSADYKSFNRTLREQDVLLLFTDGIVEATNRQDEDFGRERLEQALRDHIDDDPSGITNAVLRSMTKFTDGESPTDDICLVAVEVVPAHGTVPPAEAHAQRRTTPFEQ
jgi:phosphoserine phosphatase RsbU/P